MADYVMVNGVRLTAWMAYILGVLSDDLHRAFGVWLVITSGIRTYAEQERIFRQRYVTAGNINGRKVYDTRIWNGVRWYRISPLGTVAVPGTSNHEVQGSKAAVDLADTGKDAGVATAGSVRSNWLRARAHLYGLIASGFGFGEVWHYDVLNIWKNPPTSGGGGATPARHEEDDTMLMLKITTQGETAFVALGEGIFRHFIGTDPYDLIMRVSRSADDWQTIAITDLNAFLRTYGCDLSIWDFRDPKTGKSVPANAPGAKFMVLDPLTGNVGQGNMWSADGASRAATIALSEQIAEYRRELAEAGKAG